MSHQHYKRQSPRVERIFLSEISHYDGHTGQLEATNIGRTLNISESGILLEMTHPVPFLGIVKLNIALGDYVLSVDGEVVNLRKNQNGRIDTGIKFLDLPDEERETLKNFIY